MIVGFPLWVVILVCVGVFLGSFIDAIAGGGGTVTVPTYLLALHDMPAYYALSTNKLSAGLGTIFSAVRYIKNRCVDWRLAPVGFVLALVGSAIGAWLQLHTPENILKYALLVVLPCVAVVTLRAKNWPDAPEEMPFVRRAAIVWAAALVIGAYDGYYGPGTGTFLVLVFIRFAKMDARTAAGTAKLVNLASNLGSLFTAAVNGYVLWGLGLIAAAASMLGHWTGAGVAIKNGSRIVKPAIILALCLLAVKVLTELLFPGFWA